jgi:hypothetical protein
VSSIGPDEAHGGPSAFHRSRGASCLLVGCLALLTGCFSREMTVMGLHDSIESILEELCGLPLKPPDPKSAGLEFLPSG